jgi:hypothetical protein
MCKTVPFGTTSVSLDFAITNSTDGMGCVLADLTNVTATVAQTDGFMDATSAVFTGTLATQPFVVLASSTVVGTLVVTFPPAAPPGLRCFAITVDPGFGPMTGVVVCDVKVSISGVVRADELVGNACNVAGNPSRKVFRLENLTGVARTVAFTVTSTQTSSAPGNGDHFPIAFCGQTLGAGDPSNPTPPVLANTVVVPPGNGSFVDVCVDTKSFPGCGTGSNCHYALTGTDLASGQTLIACSDLTVITAGWNGCGMPATSVSRPGSCPNPSSLSAPGPVIGTVWQAAHAPAAGSLLDVLLLDLSASMLDIPTPFGCLLCQIPANPVFILFALPGAPTLFAVNVPNDTSLVGRPLCAQSASITGAGPLALQLSNALDMTVGDV